MAKIEIKHRFTDAVLFAHEAEGNTLKLTVEAAVSAQASLHRSDLSYSNLHGSDLSYSNLHDSNLSGSDLSDSDLRGSNLSGSNLSDSDLRGSNLSGSNLRGSNLSGSDLRGSNLSGSDLRGSNLRGSDLRGSNLSGSDLRDSDLSGSDLRGSNLSGSEIPIIPHIDAEILRAIEAPGNALDMSDWHTCETTHCRAGWAITLARSTGAELEKRFGPSAAGALIYAASRPTKRVPDFLANDADALADLRACAAADPLPSEVTP